MPGVRQSDRAKRLKRSHAVGDELPLLFDIESIREAELNDELVGITLDSMVTSVGTTYLYLRVDHDSWDRFDFKLHFETAFRLAKAANPNLQLFVNYF